MPQAEYAVKKYKSHRRYYSDDELGIIGDISEDMYVNYTIFRAKRWDQKV